MKREEIAKMPAGREMDALVMEWVTKFTVNDNFYIPHYSTDISAAWQVVDKMKERGLGFAIHCGENWRPIALFDKEESENDWIGAETAPLAICRAALLAVCNEPD